jgi:CRP/FNR family cyclic AMP-dependent transcriptional regulator
MQALEELIKAASVFEGMEERHVKLIADCGRLVDVEADEYLFRAGGAADTFWLIRSGTIALELHGAGRGQIVIETLNAGDPVGWSWLFAPYRLQFDGRATEPCSLVAFNAALVRDKCEEDHELGYQLMRRFASHMAVALTATRIQLLDVTSNVR